MLRLKSTIMKNSREKQEIDEDIEILTNRVGLRDLEQYSSKKVLKLEE